MRDDDAEFDVVIVRFLRKPNGDMRCRIVNVATRESWIIDPASDLWKLIFSIRSVS